MVDSTAVLGKLMMPLEATRAMEDSIVEWGDIPLNCWVVIAAVFLLLLNFNNYFRISSLLWAGVFRWKPNVILEDSVQTSGTRNLLSLSFILPICIVTDYFLMPESNMPAVLIAFAGYWLYKFIVAKWTKAKRVDLSFRIVIGTILIVLGLVLSHINLGWELEKGIILGAMGFFFFFQIIREIQFFKTKCRPFRTFLYLCALEFLPLGILLMIWPA